MVTYEELSNPFFLEELFLLYKEFEEGGEQMV